MGTDVDGRVAVVTGGASGIGQALVEALAAGGAQVLAADVNADGLAEIAAATGCATRLTDVSVAAENDAMIADALDAFGGLDMVFLNAGVLGRSDHHTDYRASTLEIDRYEKVRAINADGVVYGSVAAAKAMAERGGGAIVATASVAGLVGYAPTPLYSLTKAAVIGWVRAVGESFAADGVHISAICPGGVATPLVGLDASAAEASPRLLAPADLAAEMIATAGEASVGCVFSVVAGREPIRQAHLFSAVPGFP